MLSNHFVINLPMPSSVATIGQKGLGLMTFGHIVKDQLSVVILNGLRHLILRLTSVLKLCQMLIAVQQLAKRQ
jgi:hypothetical protein